MQLKKSYSHEREHSCSALLSLAVVRSPSPCSSPPRVFPTTTMKLQPYKDTQLFLSPAATSHTADSCNIKAWQRNREVFVGGGYEATNCRGEQSFQLLKVASQSLQLVAAATMPSGGAPLPPSYSVLHLTKPSRVLPRTAGIFILEQQVTQNTIQLAVAHGRHRWDLNPRKMTLNLRFRLKIIQKKKKKSILGEKRTFFTSCNSQLRGTDLYGWMDRWVDRQTQTDVYNLLSYYVII